MRTALACVALLFSCAAGKPPAPADPPAAAAAAPDAACQSDAECALTFFPEKGCCPNLCAPRVVTVKRAMELKEENAQCNHPCPKLECMPPRHKTVPACVANKCVGKAVNTDD